MPRWHLRSSLTILLVVASAIAFTVAFVLLLAYYQPRLSEQNRSDLQAKSQDLARRSEAILSLLQSQLELLGESVADGPQGKLDRFLETIVREGNFSAVYVIDAAGVVRQAAVLPELGRKRASELVGSDLSNDRLRNLVRERGVTVWSDKYLSPVSHSIAVAVAVVSGRQVIIGEIPLDFILETVTETSNPSEWSTWVADARGDILADTESNDRVGVVNLADLPIFARARTQNHLTDNISFEGTHFDLAVSRSDQLNWYFMVRSPSGLNAPKFRTALNLGLTALFTLMLLSLVLAPLWAARMARPINAIARQARRVADGERDGEWPDSAVVELKSLSNDLKRMSAAIREREQELEVIFEFSPVGILLADSAPGFAFLRANDATLQLLGYSRDEMLGKNGTELGLWRNLGDRDRLVEEIQRNLATQAEVWLNRKDGSSFLAYVQARAIQLGGVWRTLWVAEDVTDLRRIENEVRLLNVQLEGRVAERTDALQHANAELKATIDRLKFAQGELVQSEKLASLGALVAGVAHELNTPIGNGVMAISTLRSNLNSFRNRSAEGLKRSLLDSFVDAVDTGSNIAERNLRRAAELVSSFKQVAADQTSSQRRTFQLDEVIHEIALTLRPTLKHSVAELVVDIPDGITLDSYPGPLGQVVTNLIGNAAFHAFTDREQGKIMIHAALTNAGTLRLSVADDGVGIPDELQPRIFDPFVTSKMGRGGTGLGLHIAHNIVTNVLGGRISVSSLLGYGTSFELDLPLTAPLPRSTGENAQNPEGDHAPA